MASPVKRERGDDAGGATGAQYVEEKGTEIVVKNSPYGTKERQALGWGSPFAKPTKALSTKYPSLHIGASSLNGTPGKQRTMDKLLQQYTKKFMCLEHCNPYHNMGDATNWEKWHGMVPKGFVYTVKCNQYLTHMRMLQMDDDLKAHIEHFFVDRIPKLKDKFGCALLQLPPQFRCDEVHIARLQAVAREIPSTVRVAVEFRHRSWFNDQTYAILREAKWALVATHNHDTGDSPVVDTGCGYMYCRLHGSVQQYAGDYGREGMRRWAHAIRRFVAANGPDAPVYFFLNNNESHVGSLTSSVVDGTALALILDNETQEEAAAAAAPTAPPAAMPTSSVPPARPPKAPPVASGSAAACPTPVADSQQSTQTEVIDLEAA